MSCKFQDGSRHAWLPVSDARQDLIVTLDDANGYIASMSLTEEGSELRALSG